jgi:phosphoglycerol transferase
VNSFIDLKSKSLAFFVTLVIALFCFWIISLGPIAMADEAIYSYMARLLPLSDAQIPNYLYLLVYRSTNLCGDNFYSCAKFLNLCFIVITLPIIYSVARRFCTNRVSVYVAFLAFLLPTTSYTTYFLPESMYFFGFWAFIHSVLNLKFLSLDRQVVWVGVVLGFCGLIKPHALFLLPVLILYMTLTVKSSWRQVLIVSVTFVSVRFLVPYLLFGSSAVSLFGTIYSGFIPSLSWSILNDISYSALYILIGHITALLLIFSLPIMLVLTRKTSSVEDHKLVSLLILLLFPLMAIYVIFSAMVVDSSVHETANRLHLRYYSFVFPMLVMVVATKSTFTSHSSWLSIFLAVLILLVLVRILRSGIDPYTPFFTDSPLVFGLVNSNEIGLAALLSMFMVVLGIFRMEAARAYYLYLVLPGFLMVANYYLYERLSLFEKTSPPERAAMVTRSTVLDSELESLVIIGSNDAEVHRARFVLDDNRVEFLISHPLRETVAKKKSWILLLDSTTDRFANEWYPVTSGEGYSLLKRKVLPVIKFDSDSQSSWIGVVHHSYGLDLANSYGRWSIADVVGVRFYQNLPKQFSVVIEAAAFTSNRGLKFQIEVPGSKNSFLLQEYTSEVCISGVDNRYGADEIRISVPNPRSPLSMGINADARRLGLFVSKLSIVESCDEFGG